MQMKSAAGLLVAILLLGAMLSCVKSTNAGVSGTGFVWIATEGDQLVRSFNINLSNGDIGQVGSAQATGVSPVAMALTPDGKALFIANSSDGTITSYTVSSNGSLGTGATTQTSTACVLPPPPCPGAPPPPNCGVLPVALTIAPGGKFLFVANQGTFDLCSGGNNSSGTVSTYAINGTSLSFSSAVETELPTDVTGSGPSAVVASPAGNFVYVANQFTNTVQGFSYDPSSGALSALNTYTTGTNPSALAFSRCAGITQATTICPAADGDNLFVANAGSDNVSVFAACIQASTCSAADGTLAQVANSPFAAGLSPTALIVDPVLNFVYAVNSRGNNVTQFRLSTATGLLTPLTPAAVSAGVNPFGGGMTGDGTYAVVSNNNGSSMSVYLLDAGGKLTPGSTPSVPLPGQPAAILVR